MSERVDRLRLFFFFFFLVVIEGKGREGKVRTLSRGKSKEGRGGCLCILFV